MMSVTTPNYQDDVKDRIMWAVLLSAAIVWIWTPLLIVGGIWGIIFAARSQIGPALAVWGATALSFVLATILFIFT